MEYILLIEVAEGIKECYSFYKTGKKGIPESGDSKSLEAKSTWDYLPMLSLQSTTGSNKVSIESEWSGHGIIRLFKSEHASLGSLDDDKLCRELGDGRMVAMLFIPNYLTINRLLSWFIGDEVTSQTTHLQMIKMNKEKGRFMLLMKFKEQSYARDFMKNFNGKKFNEVDAETCHVVAIKELVFHQGMFSEDKDALPYMLKYPFTSSGTLGNGENKDTLIELPICPVCLERLDSEITGLITTPCQHTFHCKCLDQWKNGNCPVCRYSQLKDTDNQPQPTCRKCNEKNNLWICLICGHLGCGRYNSQHAIRHYEETSHCFAMDLNTKRVWDYAGDNYVHRIVQNEIDGKLVEVGDSSNSNVSKVNKDNHLEYVQVLLSQLESQREYYEALIYDMQQRVEALESNVQENKHTEDTPNPQLIKKLVDEKVSKVQEKLDEEIMINTGLQQNLDHLTQEIENLKLGKAKLLEENEELQSQVSDLMVHFETQAKFAENSELQNSTLVLKPTPGMSSSSTASATEKKKKKKKKKLVKKPL